ncbi:hypothetical protein CI109_101424 [Kwoniella shandongensis]|uniref:Uncharacterized protein n=1 Tax=Kwoniella shandongensis TaxID=1734106 RepID=A0A5M6BUL0_9TREE|nr:uncharacterized protein CI109_005120 [Kwoniella shandongensis]KAA5526544.1 hypothetical protein CI109_005120 [Kwoniella shandongensis]
MLYFDPRELNDLIALAARGGIGKGVALTDCVAEAPDQLMYIKDDELILLRDLGEVLLASCEGIVGWVKRDEVKFDSLASASTSTSPSQGPSPVRRRKSSSVDDDSFPPPRTILTAPSPPPTAQKYIPSLTLESPVSPPQRGETGTLEPTQKTQRELKRVSGPFELESPHPSPGLNHPQEYEDEPFFPTPTRNQVVDEQEKETSATAVGFGGVRESMVSQASSDGLGGIGGFMMGGPESEDGDATKDSEDRLEELNDEQSPSTPTLITPLHNSSISGSSPSPSSPITSSAETVDNNDDEENDEDDDGDFPKDDEDEDEDDGDWDIYGDYARESMYGPAKRMSLAVQQRRLSRAAKANSKLGPGGGGSKASTTSEDGEEADRARLARGGEMFRLPSADRKDSHTSNGTQSTSGDSEILTMKEEDQNTPRITHPPSPTTPHSSKPTGDDAPPTGRSVAMELRLRIMRERDKDGGSPASNPETVTFPATPTSPARQDHTIGTGGSDGTTLTSPENAQSSEESTEIATPHPPDVVTFTAASPPTVDKHLSSADMSKDGSGQSLLASPLPIEDSITESPLLDGTVSPSLIPPPPRLHSPNLSPNVKQSPWSPGSPSSPHSVAATKQAVEVSRSNRTGQRPRGLTLVGRMEADLRGSKGPVPITFLVNGPGMPALPSPPPPVPAMPSSTGSSPNSIGLGLPHFNGGRASPGSHEVRRATSPLASPILGNDPTASDQSSRFPAHPQPKRSVTSPAPELVVETPKLAAAPIVRPRARSFSSSVANKLGVGRKNSIPLSIDTEAPPLPLPTMASPLVQSPASSKKSFFGSRKSSLAPQTPPATSPLGNGNSLSHASASGSSTTVHHISGATPSNDSNPSLPLPSARSSSFSFSTKGSKTPRKVSRALASPISHKDFAEETIKADGMDFELVQPRKIGTINGLLSPSEASLDVHSSPSSIGSGSGSGPGPGGELKRDATMQSFASNSSLRPLPETDEWGFLKEKSPTPEIFQSRSAPGDHRVIEGKWLSIIGTPLNGSAPPKKVRKLVLDAGVPSSLRGKVWAWFMAGTLSARVPGLYQELLEHDNGQEDERIDRDVEAAYPDHSVFSEPNSPGQQDLRSILRAYSNFAPAGYRSEMALIAGALLIHCVAEDSFWLLSGLVNVVLKDYYAKEKVGMRIDSAVFTGLVQGQEPKLAALFKEVGIHPITFLDRWFSQLFIRCLPWPTTLRVIDAVVSEGPRFLLVASLAILSLSRDRLLRLPKFQTAILGYLQNIPQDSLMLPENFMKVCEGVKFDEKDWKKLREKVEKEVMGGLS